MRRLGVVLASVLLMAGVATAGYAARDARWRSDLQYLRINLPSRHPNLFFHMKPEDFAARGD